MFKIKDDPKIAKDGKFIRKYSIDELMQLDMKYIHDMSFLTDARVILLIVQAVLKDDKVC